MFTDHHRYRVYIQGDKKELCIIEAEAPIDIEHLRRFITKTRRIFRIQEDETEIRVIELRRVTERRNITSQTLDDDYEAKQQELMNTMRRILEEHEAGEVNSMHLYLAARDLFDWVEEDQVS